MSLSKEGVVKPTFIIVGAAKAGTTSLYAWLAQHPQVHMALTKEPNYFLREGRADRLERYLALFRDGVGKKAVGEASAGYLASPESAGRILEELGKIKIVILLRNPAHRAYSLYCWMRMAGLESLAGFDAALAQESVRMRDEEFRKRCPTQPEDYQYFHSGLYTSQVRRYLDLFGRDAVNVTLFDDLRDRPIAAYRRICEFLDLAGDFVPSVEIHNASVLPWAGALQYPLRAAKRFLITHPSLGLPGRVAVSACDTLMDLNVALGVQAPLSRTLEERLTRSYTEDLRQLEGLIDRDLTAWLTSVAHDPRSR